MERKTYQIKQVHLVVSEGGSLPVEAGEVFDLQFSSSLDIYRAFQQFNRLEQEHFCVLHLDGKNRIKAFQVVTIGLSTRSLVHPREVFRAAIINGAVSIILMHNHPSGDPNPSPEDRSTTARMVEVGKLVGIAVLDHIVLGRTCYFSFADEGEI